MTPTKELLFEIIRTTHLDDRFIETSFEDVKYYYNIYILGKVIFLFPFSFVGNILNLKEIKYLTDDENSFSIDFYLNEIDLEEVSPQFVPADVPVDQMKGPFSLNNDEDLEHIVNLLILETL